MSTLFLEYVIRSDPTIHVIQFVNLQMFFYYWKDGIKRYMVFVLDFDHVIVYIIV